MLHVTKPAALLCVRRTSQFCCTAVGPHSVIIRDDVPVIMCASTGRGQCNSQVAEKTRMVATQPLGWLAGVCCVLVDVVGLEVLFEQHFAPLVRSLSVAFDAESARPTRCNERSLLLTAGGRRSPSTTTRRAGFDGSRSIGC